jgi:hypothetical protein
MKTVSDLEHECRIISRNFCKPYVPCMECKYILRCDMVFLALDMILRGEY